MADPVPTGDSRRGGIGAQAAGLPSATFLDPELTRPASADETDWLVSDLYRDHALALTRTALLLVGDKPTAEDVVQDAFIGLYRALPRLSGPEKALAYLRTSVVNGCRSVYRVRRRAWGLQGPYDPPVWSAESAVMAREDRRMALQAVSRLPARAREVLALRYYLDMPEAEIAAALGISRGSVSSTTSRALAALARDLNGEL